MSKNENRFEKLKKAFLIDNFVAKNLKNDARFTGCEYVTSAGYMDYEGRIGILAEHETAVNIVSREPKRAYYIEGNHRQMGFLMGLMAEPQIAIMTTKFIENFPVYFFKDCSPAYPPDHPIFDPIKKIFLEMMSQGAEFMIKDIPEEYLIELQGMVDGCKTINPQTDVQLDHLYALNFGIDYLLSHVYPGVFGKKKRVSPFLLKPPIACNAYSIRGENVADGRHYFGRDWQFNTLGYLQFTACLTIVNPLGIPGKNLLPIVNTTAPGIIGCPAGMNSEGLAMGVDMFPTMLCTPKNPGLNGLLLARDSLQHCSSIHYDKEADGDKNDLVTHMIRANRGVSYIYPAADGKSGNACSIEAGANIGDSPFPYFNFLPEDYKKDSVLMNKIKDFLSHTEKLNKNSRTPRPVNGLMMRQADYEYPQEPLVEINRKMWELYDENFGKKLEEFAKEFSRDLRLLCHCKLIRLIRNLAAQFHELFRKPLTFDPYAFGERGFITRTHQEDNCPGTLYFAPQRETRDDFFVATNLGITPQMRLTAMSEWVTLLVGDNMQSQWRYDVLNDNVLRIIAAAGKKKGSKITAPAARNLIDYLADYGDFPGYHNPDNKAWKTIPVDGMVSLFELTEKTVECHFGFYGDEWVKLTLPNYILK